MQHRSKVDYSFQPLEKICHENVEDGSPELVPFVEGQVGVEPWAVGLFVVCDGDDDMSLQGSDLVLHLAKSCHLLLDLGIVLASWEFQSRVPMKDWRLLAGNHIVARLLDIIPELKHSIRQDIASCVDISLANELRCLTLTVWHNVEHRCLVYRVTM